MSLNQLLRQANKAWHGVKLDQPDWGDSSHSIAFSAELRKRTLLFHLILNAYWEPLDFELPPWATGQWKPVAPMDRHALDSPHDIVAWQTAPSVPGSTYRAEARSVVGAVRSPWIPCGPDPLTRGG